uniref:HK97 gp10 family phage protein n=1 Tax=Pectobacterium carotovorum TaxID=554 RepID=A0A0K0MPV4_PECCA|nr:hypothetical protein [Pectobacterium carotovorum]AKG47472.1 hypothetical protein pA_00032 [Pectobacterium carotovorum]
MGLSVNIGSFKRAQERLTHSQNALKRNLLNEMRKMASEMQKYARAMSPRDSGSLEKSIYAKVENSKNEVHVNLFVSEYTPRRGFNYRGKMVKGVIVGSYAGYMHDSQYRLGVRSREKQRLNYGMGMKVKVGRGFIERSGNTVWKRRRDGLKDVGIRAGFGKGRWK